MFVYFIMSQFGGNNAKKSSSDSKRHFTVVMGVKSMGFMLVQHHHLLLKHR
jgi:hypothetical protein